MPSTSTYRPLIIAGSIVLTVTALSLAKALLIPLALSILLSFILTPLVMALQNRGLQRVWAVALIVVVVLALVGGLVAALMVELHDLAFDIVANKEKILQKARDLGGDRPGIVGQLFRLADDLQTDLHKAPTGAPQSEPQAPVEVKVQAERSSALAMAPYLLAAVYGNIGTIGMVIAFTVSIQLTREDLRNRIIGLIGGGHLTSTTRAIDEATRGIRRYLLVQVLLNAAFGAIFGMALFIIGIPYALLWGFVTAVLRFIPYIGTWLGAIPPLVVSLTIGAWMDVVLVSIFVLVLGLAINNVIEPMLVSRSTEVAPFPLVASAAFWTWLWGPIGLILATPMTVCMSVLGRYVPGLGFLDTLLGNRSALEPDLALYQRLLAHDLGEAAELVEAFGKEHTFDELADTVVVPALVRLRCDEVRGELSSEEASRMLRTLREVLESQILLDESEEKANVSESPLVLACPAHDEREELVLTLLQRMLGPKRGCMTLLSSKLTSAEVVQKVVEQKTPLVCVVSLAPCTSAQARYLCKRLRASNPQQAIIVGALGSADELVQDSLVAAGATLAGDTLQATLRHLLSRLNLQPAVAN